MKRFFCMLVIGIFVLGSVLVPLDGQSKQRTKAEKEVLEVLKKFQAGYTARDVAKLDEFMSELFDPEDCLIAGTTSYGPGSMEWSDTMDSMRKLVEYDWKHWDDLKMEVDEARIRVNGNTAWVAFWGTSEGTKVKRGEYDRALKEIVMVIKHCEKDEEEEISLVVMLYVLKKVARYLERYVPSGNEYIYPIRATIVLQKKKGKWLIQLMDFAFPDKDIPDVQVAREEEK